MRQEEDRRLSKTAAAVFEEAQILKKVCVCAFLSFFTF
jgi:hypothetical protein